MTTKMQHTCKQNNLFGENNLFGARNNEHAVVEEEEFVGWTSIDKTSELTRIKYVWQRVVYFTRCLFVFSMNEFVKNSAFWTNIGSTFTRKT